MHSAELKYSFFPTFTIRTPLKPVDFIEKHIYGSDVSDEDLISAFRIPEVNEAIYLASPELYSELIKWAESGLQDENKARKLKFALWKYLVRISTRSTPFGLFAGISAGEWGNKNEIILKKLPERQRNTRLDMHYLGRLASDLVKNPGVQKQLKYYPNSSIYRIGNKMRYVEARWHDFSKSFHLVSVGADKQLRSVLKYAESGKTPGEIIEHLKEGGFKKKEAENFVEKIIQNQLLTSGMEPSLTDPDYLKRIIKLLKKNPDAKKVSDKLKSVNKSLSGLDSFPDNGQIHKYEKVHKKLKQLGTSYHQKYLFQVDLNQKTSSCQLDSQIGKDLLKGIEVLTNISPPVNENALTRFTEKFTDRYQDLQIPLLQALDPETGIPYRSGEAAAHPSPLLDDLDFPISDPASYKFDWFGQYDILTEKYQDA